MYNSNNELGKVPMLPLRLLCGAEKFLNLTRGTKEGISPLSMLLSSRLGSILVIIVEKNAQKEWCKNATRLHGNEMFKKSRTSTPN